MAKLTDFFSSRAQNDEAKEGQADAPAAGPSSPAKSIDSRSVYGGGRLAVRDDDEDTETISNRIFINRNTSQTSRLLHCVNPKFFQKGEGKYLMVAFKLPPAFLPGARFTIENDGLSASLFLRLPLLCYDPCVLLGLDLDENHPFYQGVHKELVRISGHSDNVAKFKIGLKLPFKCERQTTPDLIGHGQRADALPVKLSGTKKGEPRSYVGNAVVYLKKADESFAVTTRGSVRTFSPKPKSSKPTRSATQNAVQADATNSASGTGPETGAAPAPAPSVGPTPQIMSPTHAVGTTNLFQNYETDENGHKRLRVRDSEGNAEMDDEMMRDI
ncbi:predicted protein [Chaetoceros tenuissimus]|uniref:Uncharacterized protein n=1 Tax=Chaetoceros tenuissimus TaxID=426638 RepID=A0AAD3HB60_9STRA|nr:predicted protein [Chaetoceros tenuissimus]